MPMFVCLFYSETAESLLVIKGPQGRINRAIWGPLNKTIISAGEDAVIRIWDSEVRICFLLSIFIYFANTHTLSM
jgi:WD40 repeat protein